MNFKGKTNSRGQFLAKKGTCMESDRYYLLVKLFLFVENSQTSTQVVTLRLWKHKKTNLDDVYAWNCTNVNVKVPNKFSMIFQVAIILAVWCRWFEFTAIHSFPGCRNRTNIRNCHLTVNDIRVLVASDLRKRKWKSKRNTRFDWYRETFYWRH